jgi:protein TonB
VTRYSLAQQTLFESDGFRRLLLWSAGIHISMALLFALGPQLYKPRLASTPVFVEVLSPAEAAAPASPPKQVVDEPIVIPKRPRPKPKPQTAALTPPKPKPKPQAKPSLTPQQLIDQMRKAQEGKRGSKPAGSPTGRFAPELAGYQRQLVNLIYSNWVGARPFSHRAGLQVTFEVQVDAGGNLKSVRLLESSGERALDESAERAIFKSAPFPPPPSSVRTIRIRMNPREKA